MSTSSTYYYRFYMWGSCTDDFSACRACTVCRACTDIFSACTGNNITPAATASPIPTPHPGHPDQPGSALSATFSLLFSSFAAACSLKAASFVTASSAFSASVFLLAGGSAFAVGFLIFKVFLFRRLLRSNLLFLLQLRDNIHRRQ